MSCKCIYLQKLLLLFCLKNLKKNWEYDKYIFEPYGVFFLTGLNYIDFKRYINTNDN